jgi:hypothetical protein
MSYLVYIHVRPDSDLSLGNNILQLTQSFF